MTSLHVSLNKNIDDSYDILFETDIQNIISDIKKSAYGKKYAIICDSKVQKLYGNDFETALQNQGVSAQIFSFPHGESSKNLQTVETLLDDLAKAKFYRDDAVIALGGGVTGDISAFVSSIYMRGIPYIQIPTTLLSMVDSSVGGKTGVDTPYGKNLIGTFYQPKKVYVNVEYMKTLPQKQIQNGIAEVIKYGVISEKKILEYLKTKKQEIFDVKRNVMEEVVRMCIQVKADVVETDEKEGGLRKILNYGHTFGHAIEKLSHFKIQHGEGVAIGMIMINDIAVEKKWFDQKECDYVKNIIMMYDLPTKYEANIEELLEAVKLDKKVKDGKVVYIVPKKIGEVFFSDEIDTEDIRKII